MAPKNPRIIALFDVDGTLTAARKTATAEMLARLQKLRQSITIGVVGGSDLVKQKEQLGEDGQARGRDGASGQSGEPLAASILLTCCCCCCASLQNLKSQYTNAQINRLVNYILRYVADLDIPVKRGTFLEFRMGMINVSPIGRNCSQEERDEFEKYDHIHKIRETFVEKLRAEFPEYNLTFSIGGQISFDVFPTVRIAVTVSIVLTSATDENDSVVLRVQGWDKTFCLRYLDPKDYDEIHFFGDKTHKGGNDYEIYTSERTIGHSVKNPEETIQILDQLFP
ncbi:unnamed protein product [Phytophthora lilii]|uniref:Phosphomannomutase n=1 Tax=Phytophthora lilii TaxID=2077276 RepID=A0A9W6YIL9_9STRA|nr:unnamed protein product [Phytophthora lilii]